MYRVLFTGSRTWTDFQLVEHHISELDLEWGNDLVLVHGACSSGLDDMVDRIAQMNGLNLARYPADWSIGRRAGFVRNADMVAAGADVCYAYIHNQSKGATMCADLAEKAGIQTWRFLA